MWALGTNEFFGLICLRFSVDVLNTLCQQSNGQPLAGVVVIGDGGSARAVAMSGSSMGLPVLWAKGGTANLDGMHREVRVNWIRCWLLISASLDNLFPSSSTCC